MKSTVERTNEEEMLQILGEKSPVGVCIIQDGKFCYFNSNFPIAIGYTADELLGKDPLELIVPEDREMVRENEIKMLKGELLSPYQFRVIHKDGSIRWVTEAVRSIQYHGRRAVLGNYMEVSERKQMEEALKESEEKYRELANSITNVFFAMDEHLRYTYWNGASEILTGIRAEDAIGKSIREIFPDEPWRRRAEKVYRKVLKTQQSQTFVNDYDIDGRHYVFEISAYPSRSGIAVFVKDITEHKQMEETLREAEEEKSTLLEEAPVGIINADLEGKITYVNKRFELESGYLREEIVGKNSLQLGWFSADTTKYLAERIAARLRGDPAKHWETQFKCKDGHWIWIELEGKIIIRLGVPVGFQIIASNITERKQAEEALRQSEERYRTILEETEDSYFEVDLGGHLTLVNSATCSKLGYSKEELIGMSYKKTTLEDDIDSVFRIFNEVYRTGKPNKNCVWTTVCKDGTHRLIEHSAFPLKNDKGEIIGFRGVGRDITERKQAEEKLQRSKEKYRALFDSSVIGTLVVDAETMKVMIGNQAAVKMFGFSSAEEGTGVNLLDFVPPEEREKALELLKRELFEQNSRRAFDLQAVTKDGRTIWISATGARIMHKDRLAGLLCFTDVTERKQAEEALRRSEERYRTILEEMEDSYFEVDLGGHLTFVNSATCRALGYSREELIGKSYKDYTAEEDIESVFQIFNEVYKTGVPNKGFAWKTIRKDGVQGFAETSVSPLRNDKGEIIGFRGVGRDVTERKQTEEALQAERNKLQSVIDAMQDALTIQDRDYNIIYQNEPARISSGDGRLGEKCYRVYEGNESICEDCPVEKAFKDGKPHTSERQRVLPSGELSFWETTANPIRDAGGKVISCLEIGRNITDRKKQEQALADELTRRRILVDQSLDGIHLLDEDARVVEANQRFAEMLGYTPEEVQELHTWDWDKNFPPEKILEMGRNVDEKGLHLETKHTRKDGSVIDVDISISKITYGGQRLIFCISRDITERNRAEEALRQSEEKYRALFDSAVVGTIVIDAETTKLIVANQAAAEMLGFSSPEELVGLDALTNIPPEDKEGISELMVKDLFEQDLRKTREFRVTTKDGREIWISANASRIIHEGKLAGLISFTDITERKRAEEALRLAAQEWSRTFDSISDAISIHDKDFRILRANKAFADLFRKDFNEIINIYCYELHKGKEPRSGCPHQHTLTTGKPASTEFYESHLGKYLVESTSPIFNEQGEVVATVHITRDITEQKRQNERLMMTDRLASLGEMAAGTAHELNNPLTSIIGFSQLLMEKEVPDDIRDDLKLIHSEAQRAANVTKDLLTFARKHAPMKQPNQINSIIEDVLQLRAHVQKNRGIEIERHLAPDLPEIMVDYFQMQQVFLNIIINAEYFMTEAHKKGTLTITTKKQNNSMMISFADDGPGISSENLTRIFDPFFTTKEAGKGTGLGLSICHGIVIEHGGQIYVRSQLGKGTTIFVELPIKSRSPY
jgi:PAS domain S-box-containing protein